MRKGKINKLIQTYSEIPIAGFENDLNRVEELKKLPEKELKTGKSFGSFIRKRYIYGAVVCIILVAIILPISLVFFKEKTGMSSMDTGEQTFDSLQENPKDDDAPEILFCSADQTNLKELDSIETFNNLYGYNIDTIHIETVLSIFYELRLKEEDLLIGAKKEEHVWNDKIDSVITIVYVSNHVISNFKFEYLPYSIDVDGIIYKYNIIQEVDYEYYVEYIVDNLRFQSYIVCYEEMEIQDLINYLFA